LALLFRDSSFLYDAGVKAIFVGTHPHAHRDILKLIASAQVILWTNIAVAVRNARAATRR